MGDRQFDVVFFAGRYHSVGFFERAAHGFFHVDVNASLSSSQNHFAMFVEPARADADDVWFSLVKQFAVISECLRGTKSLGSCRAAFLIHVGNCDDLDVGQMQPSGIKAVAIIAAAGVTDDANTVLGRHVGEFPALFGWIAPTRRRVAQPNGLLDSDGEASHSLVHRLRSFHFRN